MDYGGIRRGKQREKAPNTSDCLEGWRLSRLPAARNNFPGMTLEWERRVMCFSPLALCSPELLLSLGDAGELPEAGKGKCHPGSQQDDPGKQGLL